MESKLNISSGFFKAFSSYFIAWSISDRSLIVILLLFAHDLNSPVSILTSLGSEIPSDTLAARSFSVLCPLGLTDELEFLAPLPSAYKWLLGFLGLKASMGFCFLGLMSYFLLLWGIRSLGILRKRVILLTIFLWAI